MDDPLEERLDEPPVEPDNSFHQSDACPLQFMVCCGKEVEKYNWLWSIWATKDTYPFSSSWRLIWDR